MKHKVLLLAILVSCSWIIYTGFSSDNTNDDGPRWNPSPSTRINSGTVIQDYAVLPQQDLTNPVINEPDFYSTPQGVFVVNSPFRVHPITSGHQTEVPITRHPTNPLIMFGSANTSRGGNFSTGWYVTTDGGTSWFGNDTLLSSTGTPIHNFGDPGPVIDRNGRFINSYITLTGQMGASWSTNNGVNWSSTVTFPGSTTSSDKNFSSTDDAPSSAFYGRSYTYYTEFSNSVPANFYRILGTRTADGGVSWSSVAPVSPLPVSGSGYFHQGADTKCGPNGEVYVVWTCANSGVSPFTEDSLGFAKSTNGGVSWTIAKNNAANVNGNRTFNMMNGIRVAGFPRIDVDRTCGTRAGWIYVTVGEKNPGVAGDVSDIVLYKSTNGGTSFSSGVRVNQDAFGNGRKQYMAAVRVDESGGVNVVYYDTRNTPTNDSAEVYLSRSTDGGVTFTDLKVGAKFRHAPTGVPGVNTQYAGDYIGITSALIEGNPVNGNQRIWPYWMSNASGVYNAWTAKVELTPKNPCPGCQDFSSSAFTPDYYALEFTGTQYWTRQTPSAYAAGTGSAKFDFWNAVSGVNQSLTTDFEAVGAGNYLTFDRAYSPWSSGTDSLIIETSTNGGVSFTALSRLWGNNSGSAPLNTVGIIADFSPTTGGQWAPMIFALPAGTNKIKFRAYSGFGNNLYLDNICIKSLPTTVNSNLYSLPEGFYRALPFPQAIPDTTRVYLCRTDFPNVAVDSAVTYMNSIGLLTNANFSKALNGNYYIVFKHRNTIETWSAAGGLAYTRGAALTLDLINNLAGSYLSSVKLIDPAPYYGMYGGDINQDGLIEASDISLVENASFISLSGYVREDVTGDDYIDGSDVSIVENNTGVSIVAPPGAAPSIKPEDTDQRENLKTESDFKKYESGKIHIENEIKTSKQTYENYLRAKETMNENNKVKNEQRKKANEFNPNSNRGNKNTHSFGGN